jgi:hypothetical protein
MLVGRRHTASWTKHSSTPYKTARPTWWPPGSPETTTPITRDGVAVRVSIIVTQYTADSEIILRALDMQPMCGAQPTPRRG